MEHVKAIGFTVLAVYLILLGLAGLLGFALSPVLVHLLELVAGAFILFGVWTCCRSCGVCHKKDINVKDKDHL